MMKQKHIIQTSDSPNLQKRTSSEASCTQQRNITNSDDDVIIKRRRWQRISSQERLQLEAAVGFGLPIEFASKVVNMSSRNANRTMKEQLERNKFE